MIPANPGKAFKVAVGDELLDRLERRLQDTLLPDQDIIPDAEWQYGTNLDKLKQLLEDWKTGKPKGSDGKPTSLAGNGVKEWWRNVEARMNRHPHYLTSIEGVKVHYQIARSADPAAIPLIFSHGWPGSFFEADLLLDELTRTDRPGPSFHVVVPSLPGYGFSDPPPRKGWKLSDTARLFNSLMVDVLKFPAYLAQGGDWGYVVTRYLALYPACKVFHTNFAPPNIPFYAKPLMLLEQSGWKGIVSKAMTAMYYDPFEVHGVQRGIDYLTTGSGYFNIQSTKPATVGYGLHDSPVAVLSYLVEKFEIWSDPRCPAFCKPTDTPNRASGISDENILINTSLYVLTNSIHTSFLPYFESGGLFGPLAQDHKLTAASAQKPYGRESSFTFMRSPQTTY